MACRDAYPGETKPMDQTTGRERSEPFETAKAPLPEKLFFGVDSRLPSDDLLQNNLTLFEWVIRNKAYPNFWGRPITGENSLTKEEIVFLHRQGCKIAALYEGSGEKETEEQGKIHAGKAVVAALERGIPAETALFLEAQDNETMTAEYMKGYAQGLLLSGYTPGFKANTDASCGFDRAYSRGMQTDKDVFARCLIWATAPALKEYERVTTTHLLHPDRWAPFAPSGTARNDIAVWQYGRDCHPLEDDAGNEAVFHVSLVKNEPVLLTGMF